MVVEMVVWVSYAIFLNWFNNTVYIFCLFCLFKYDEKVHTLDSYKQRNKSSVEFNIFLMDKYNFHM